MWLFQTLVQYLYTVLQMKSSWQQSKLDALLKTMWCSWKLKNVKSFIVAEKRPSLHRSTCYPCIHVKSVLHYLCNSWFNNWYSNHIIEIGYKTNLTLWGGLVFTTVTPLIYLWLKWVHSLLLPILITPAQSKITHHTPAALLAQQRAERAVSDKLVAYNHHHPSTKTATHVMHPLYFSLCSGHVVLLFCRYIPPSSSSSASLLSPASFLLTLGWSSYFCPYWIFFIVIVKLGGYHLDVLGTV